jgi:hypothetical protein
MLASEQAHTSLRVMTAARLGSMPSSSSFSTFHCSSCSLTRSFASRFSREPSAYSLRISAISATALFFLSRTQYQMQHASIAQKEPSRGKDFADGGQIYFSPPSRRARRPNSASRNASTPPLPPPTTALAAVAACRTCAVPRSVAANTRPTARPATGGGPMAHLPPSRGKRGG